MKLTELDLDISELRRKVSDKKWIEKDFIWYCKYHSSTENPDHRISIVSSRQYYNTIQYEYGIIDYSLSYLFTYMAA